MRISAKGRYAIKFMLDLAVNYDGQPVSIKDVAKRQNISVKYLEQVASMLNKAYFIRSMRGFKGGYILYDKPENYTVGQILRVTEGSLAPVEDMGQISEDCDTRVECVSTRIWEQLYNAINAVLENITLLDLVEWYHEMDANQYVI